MWDCVWRYCVLSEIAQALYNPIAYQSQLEQLEQRTRQLSVFDDDDNDQMVPDRFLLLSSFWHFMLWDIHFISRVPSSPSSSASWWHPFLLHEGSTSCHPVLWADTSRQCVPWSVALRSHRVEMRHMRSHNRVCCLHCSTTCTSACIKFFTFHVTPFSLISRINSATQRLKAQLSQRINVATLFVII